MNDATVKPIFYHAYSTDFSELKQLLPGMPGYNHTGANNLLSAESDAEAIKTFLLDYKQEKLTYRSYLKEIERLVLWCVYQEKIKISDLKREHLMKYKDFLQDPQPIESWCGKRQPKVLKSGEVNPDWRPFVGGISKTTLRKTVSILDSFFNFLVQNNYFTGNPLSSDKRRKGKKSQNTDRWLEKDEINITLETLSAYQAEAIDELHRFKALRARFIILTLFYTGLRIAELSNHKMSDFILIENEWYLKIVGKGDKPRKVVVVDEYLDILVEFRKSIGLRPLPDFNEDIPLIPAINIKNPITINRISQIIKWSFMQGAAKFESLALTAEHDISLNYQFKAAKLKQASAHWLRHSYGTYLVKSGCPLEKVRTLMGHSDISTTMIYVHFAKKDLHEAAQNLSLDPI